MSDDAVFPDPGTDLGRRVQERLRAEIREDVPPPDESPEYLAEYGDEMTRIMGSPGAFAQQYSVAAVVRVERVRGAAPQPS